MKKKLSLITALSMAFLAFSQETSVLRTGDLLFICPSEPVKVYLDDRDMGYAPLFLSDISSQHRLIQLKGADSYAEAHIEHDPWIEEVTSYAPLLTPYPAYLSIRTNVDNGILYINDLEYDIEGTAEIPVSEGRHVIRLEGAAYIPEERVVVCRRLTITEVDIPLKQMIPISLKGPLPAGATVTFREKETDKTLSYTNGDKLMVFSGSWQGTIRHPAIRDEVFDFAVRNLPVEVAIELDFHTPRLQLIGLKKNSTILLDEVDVSLQMVENVLTVQPGDHILKVHSTSFHPIELKVGVAGSETVEIQLQYVPLPVTQRRQYRIKGVTWLSSGALLLTGGLLLNDDEWLISVTEDYETYRLGKLSSLGLGGAGLGLSLVGLTYGIISFLQ